MQLVSPLSGNKNELQNVRAHNLGTDPGGLVTGDKGLFWINTTGNKLKYYDGTSVVTIGTMDNPMTTVGDLIVGGASGAPGRLAAGTATYLLTSNGPGVAPTWQAAAAGFADPMTTLGDMIVRGGGGTTRVGGPTTNGLYILSETTAASVAGVPVWLGTTGSGNVALATSPTFVTPTLGVATATKVNLITITQPATGATLTLVEGSTLATSGAFSTTLTATGATNVTLPTTGTLATLAGSEVFTNKTLTGATLTAGTLTVPALKMLSGQVLTTPVAGVFEFVTDTLSFTISTGTARKTVAFTDSTLTGVWNGTVVAGQYGGTGVANTGKTITLGGNLVTSGAFNTTFVQQATLSFTLPAVTGTLVGTGDTGSVTSIMLAGSIANAKLTNSAVTIGSTAVSLGATVTSFAGIANFTHIAGTTTVAPMNFSTTGSVVLTTAVVGALEWDQSNLYITNAGPTRRTILYADLSNIGSTLVAGANGGTGVNNSGKTITLGGNLTTAGAFPITLTASASTNITLPTSGTLMANPMTTLGDLLYGGASGAPTRLIGNTSNAKVYLNSTSSGGVAVAPIWSNFNADAIASLLTGFASADGTVTATDSILTAFQKTYYKANNANASVHTQNTDTGTTSATFQLQSGSSGPKLKNNAGQVELRNAADNAFADLRVANLYVTGTTTQIDSNTVSIGDSILELNTDVATAASNSDGGIVVKRLDADNTTRRDATLNFNNTTGEWNQTYGANTAAGNLTAIIPRKYAVDIGNGALTIITVTHNLHTKDVAVEVFTNATTYDKVYPEIQHTTTDTLTLIFTVAPTAAQYRCVVIG